MNKFTIRDIENLSGIKAHTLRVWEQRYNIITPKRKDSNHRFYDNDDLKHILRISFLYHNGIKISRIAQLEESAIEQIISNTAQHNSYEFHINQLMEASLDFDEDKFERVLDDALQETDIEEIMLNVVYPFLQKIGLLWLTEHLIPAQEHFSSNIISRKILVATDELKNTYTLGKKTVLLFSPPKEHHEIGLLLLQYLLKKNGHKVVYFGCNVPVANIEEYCAERNVTHLHFHLITHLNHFTAEEYLKELATFFPTLQIVMSGPVVRSVQSAPGNVRLLHSIGELINYIRE